MKKDTLIYFDLITSLKTTQEVTNLISEIDSLVLTFFKSEKPSIEKALATISTNFAEKIMQIFTKSELDINDKKTATNVFETIKDLTTKLKVIKLTLAFDPTRKTIENLHNFVKDTVGIGYILDIEVSEEVLGGAIVIFNGKYKDFTLKKMIEDTFANNQIAISKLAN